MEKPYTSIDSKLILQLKQINNLVDIENKLKIKSLKLIVNLDITLIYLLEKI